MSDALLDIKLFNDHAMITKPGSAISKPVSIKDLIGVLSESAQNAMQYSRTDMIRLPENTYLSAYAGNVLNLVMYVKEHPTVLKHTSGSGRPSEYEIMMPNVVLHLALKVMNGGARHELIQAHYFCTSVERDNLPQAIPGRLTGVFGYLPFPNMYDNFTMCFGGNTMLTSVDGGDLRVFKMYYDVLENSPFNNDLRLMNVKYDYDGYADWFAKLAEVYKDEKRFPYELITI